MKKAFLIFLFLGVNSLSHSVLSQTPRPTATPDADTDTDIIKVSTTLIQVDVVVTDKKNNQVTNLKLDDFEVYENGKKQEITSFSYISSKSTTTSNMSSADNLNLQDDRDGLSLKDKISIPIITKPADANNIRRTFVLVVDNLGLNFRSIDLVKKSLKKFINEQIKEGDLATIVTTGGTSVIPAFTSDKKQLLEIVKKLKWNPQSRGGADNYEPIRNTLLEEISEARMKDVPGVRQESALLEDIDRERKNNSAVGTLGALNYIVRGMRNLPGRKALVFFSEGFSLSESSSQASSSADRNNPDDILASSAPAMNNRFSSGVSGALNMLVKTANQSSVVIYTVDPRGLDYLGMANSDDDITKAFGRDFKPGQTGDKRTIREDYFKQTQEGLRVLASETGGFAILNQNDLNKGLEKVIDDQSYYLLSYITNLETVNSSNDAIDKVEIKVKQPDLQVRYRNAFYSSDMLKEENLAQTPREKIGRALAYPFKANEIKLNLYSITGNNPEGDFARFLINISAKDLDFKKESKGNRQANFDMLAITLDGDSKPIDQFVKNFTITVNEPTYQNILKKGFVYVLPVFLKKSGVYHFRIAIHDSKTGKIGAAQIVLDTPKFEKKRLWISNPTLKGVSRDKENSNEQENDKKVFTDTTLRQFSLPVFLDYAAVIYNATTDGNNSPNLSIQTRLIQNNKVILETPPEPISTENQTDLQRIDLFGRIDLPKNLAPGDYIFQIIVIDNLARKNTQIATQLVDFEVF